MSKSKIKDILFYGLWGVGLILFFAAVIHYFLRTPGTLDFRLHRAKYDRIITTAKTMGVSPGGYSHFWITTELEPIPPAQKHTHNDMIGMVNVFHDDGGGYHISIVTRDEGSTGTFGYIFSDGELTFPENTTGLTSVQRDLDTHWWEGYNGRW